MKKILVDKNLVMHVSGLARLAIDKSEIAEYEKNFKAIVEYVEQLGEVDTKSVEPLFNPITENLSAYSENKRKQRDDEVSRSLGVDELLQNAPSQKNKQFRIKAVLEDS